MCVFVDPLSPQRSSFRAVIQSGTSLTFSYARPFEEHLGIGLFTFYLLRSARRMVWVSGHDFYMVLNISACYVKSSYNAFFFFFGSTTLVPLLIFLLLKENNAYKIIKTLSNNRIKNTQLLSQKSGTC